MQGQPALTQGAIRRLLDDEKNLQPVVQCIGAKPLTNQQEPGNVPPRFRLAISDGEHWCTAMLATQMNEKVSKGLVGNLSVMRLTDYLTSFSQDKKIVIILNLDNLGVSPSTIGQPRSLETPKNQAQQQQQHGGPTSNQPTQRYQSSSAPPTGGYGPQLGNSSGQGSGYGMNAYGQQPNHHPAGQQPGQQNGGYGAANGPIAGGYGQAPNYRSNNAPIARDDNAPRIMPINSLNAYQNRWTVKARITQRSEVRRYTTARGEGKFFSVDLLDAEGGEIRAVAFNQVADQFDEVLQAGKLILLSKATLKPKKPGSTYNQTRHDHEMTLEKSTVIREIKDDEEAAKIPQIIYRFRKIGEVENCAPTTQVDVVGIVDSIEPPATITRRDGGETTKRSLTIKDDSNHSIELTLWGGCCSSPGDELDAVVNGRGEKPVLACKSVRVGEFGGRSLSTISSTQMAVNPDHPATAALRDWYQNKGGAMTEATKLSGQRGSGAGRSDRRVTFATIDEERLGTSGNPDYVAVACTITMVKDENMYYPACSLQYNNRPCNKKLSNNSGDGQNWWCDRCQQESRPDWRYILTVKADDHTGGMYLTAFQEAGTQIMGMPASELRELAEGNDGVLEKAKSDATHQPLMLKLKIAEESYNDETRVKKNIMRAEKLDFAKESHVMLDFISKLSRGEAVMQGAPQALTGGGGYGGPANGGSVNGGATTPVHGGYGGTGNGYGGGVSDGYGAGYGGGGNGYGGGGNGYGGGYGGGNSYGQTGNQGVYGGSGKWGGF